MLVRVPVSKAGMQNVHRIAEARLGLTGLCVILSLDNDANKMLPELGWQKAKPGKYQRAETSSSKLRKEEQWLKP